jgi:hypothetical protein
MLSLFLTCMPNFILIGCYKKKKKSCSIRWISQNMPLKQGQKLHILENLNVGLYNINPIHILKLHILKLHLV